MRVEESLLLLIKEATMQNFCYERQIERGGLKRGGDKQCSCCMQCSVPHSLAFSLFSTVRLQPWAYQSVEKVLLHFSVARAEPWEDRRRLMSDAKDLGRA
ncbi:hypothetical protein VHEMI09674 [[Torrubiella] hemipterigena]|uniref:Uncharacterized protein n=1 Tax=[Torrubiella] hemipterigena TaxID=1531966 RepID=A0A0A1TQS4_9HYPO|nr:hypothetical protein VHEMI09674 [[Torrubiella] hemipterigena]